MMWDNVVVFPFYEIYFISFANKFNFIDYISKNNPHIIHALQIFKVQIQLGMDQLIRLVTNKSNMILFI